ncbi:MAG: thioredoxin family protein [Planctomycetes bacterium]|nr:thioredoxin family protein [Planctomycetota bacterium]
MRSLSVASWFASAVVLTPLASAQEPAKKPAAPPVYDEAADGKQVVAAAIAKAKHENRRVLIQWGANWCGWCKWLAGTMKSDRDVAHELLYEYVVVHVDVGRFDKNLDLAKSLGAEFKAIPFLTVLDGDGKAIVQQNTEPFEINEGDKRGHDPAKLLEFLTAHRATPLVAKDVLAGALAEARSAHKRVFLHFGAPWCGWCHRLEDWMARPEIAALLAKDFVDVKIDNDRMTGAKAIYEAQLATAGVKPGGIPWFVFLDENGALLAHSNGPDGNLGFPFQPAEVEHFGALLRQVRQNLGDDDIAALVDSLHANRTATEAEREARKAKAENGNG